MIYEFVCAGRDPLENSGMIEDFVKKKGGVFLSPLHLSRPLFNQPSQMFHNIPIFQAVVLFAP